MAALSSRITKLAVAAAAVTAGVAGGVALANTPNTTTIHACKTVAGLVRVVDQPSQCRRYETPLQWNVQGPPGAPGVPGPAGPAGPAGPPGAAVPPAARWAAQPAGVPLPDTGAPATVVSLSLPAGTWAITTAGEVARLDGGESLSVVCDVMHNGSSLSERVVEVRTGPFTTSIPFSHATVAQFAAPGSLNVDCASASTASIRVFGAEIVAVEVTPG